MPELTPAERLELDAKIHDMNLPVEEGGQGMTQQEIAARLDLAQSTICASIKRETMRRMSEGLEPAAPHRSTRPARSACCPTILQSTWEATVSPRTT